PALIQPSRLASMGGIFFVVLAALLLSPSSPTLLTPAAQPAGAIGLSLPLYLTLRLGNGLLIFPLGVQLAREFRRQSADNVIASGWLWLAYALALGLFVGLLTLPRGRLRLGVGVFAVVYNLGLIMLAGLRTKHIMGRSDRAAQQVRLLVIGVWLAQLPMLLRMPIFLLSGATLPFNLVLLAQFVLPITYAYAILYHDLYAIDTTVRRALAAIFVYAAIITLYLLVTLLLTRFFFLQQTALSRLWIMCIILLAAGMFQPIYRGLQGRGEQLLFPERAAFQAALAEAQTALVDAGGRGQIGMIVEQFALACGAEWGAIAERQNGSAVWEAHLQVAGRDFGRMQLGSRALEFSSAENQQLNALASQVTLALAYAETLSQLDSLNQNLEQQVRDRTTQLLEQQHTLAVVEVRQRLARDLHDSVTQTLFSLNLSLRAIRILATKQPERVADELAVQEVAAQHALSEMRALLTQLRAPLIEDGDLAKALRRHCTLLAQRGFTVTVAAPVQLILPAETATELFYVAREALHNAEKHSGNRMAACALACKNGWLHLTIVDQGRGMVLDSAEKGAGLDNMRERVAQIGGTFELMAAPNQGTLI
ncbi:MAG TPA: hypothetical protein ENJ56_07150, partial [Anaerolineae bacterium]|nr:hypothetical protein [Anaerolineae bacterium]